MKFYIINYENGSNRFGYFESYNEALNYAECNSGGDNFTIEEYENELDYLGD